MAVNSPENEKIQKKAILFIDSIENPKERKTLFQYRLINTKTVHQLLRKYVWASSPKEFNDIFDCCAFEKFINSRAISFNKRFNNIDRCKTIKSILGMLRIASFSSTYKNPTMWAHYAKNNNGICIAYDVSNSTDIHRVIYLKDALEFRAFYAAIEDMRGVDFLGENFLQIMSCLKFSTWRYENEWRYVSENPINQVPIEPKEIMLGVNTSAYNEDILSDIAGTLKIKVSRMKVDSTNFQLTNINT